MIVIPKNRPVIEGLNSFYLNVARFIEHYSGEVGTGGIHKRDAARRIARRTALLPVIPVHVVCAYAGRGRNGPEGVSRYAAAGGGPHRAA